LSHRLSRRGAVLGGLGALATPLVVAAESARPKPKSRPYPKWVAPTPTPAPAPEPVVVNGRTYDAYVPAASKIGQWFWYTCEFDAAWAIFATYGYDIGFDEQIGIVGLNQDPEPWYDASGPQVLIYGGDIGETFCGDYQHNLLAKLRSTAMKKVFDAYDFQADLVRDQTDIERCLLQGGLVFMKVTVDFKPYTPATWIATNGKQYPTAFTNDHAVVPMGFNAEAVVIRDVLGPTDTNWDRQYEYEVPWELFWTSAQAHGIDGLTVLPPAE
jgi:hypothetical protein